MADGTLVILRVVECGATEETNFDLDLPADLVALEEIGGKQVEIARKAFESGHEASRYLAQLIRNK